MVRMARLGGDAQQLQYVQQMEQLYSRRILDILEPVVGRQNVKAQVTAELDFSQTESTSESHKPNQTPDATAIRSQQVIGEQQRRGRSGAALGRAGRHHATSHPAPSRRPINGAAAGAGRRRARRRAPVPAGPSANPSSTTRWTRRCKVVRGGTGIVKRISAAVVVNHQTTTDDKGKTTTTPLTDAADRENDGAGA